jgi:antitoxin YefM
MDASKRDATRASAGAARGLPALDADARGRLGLDTILTKPTRAIKTLPLSEAKSKLSGLVERVRVLEEEVLITKNGRPAAVLVNPEEFASWKETVAIRADSPLMREIRAGLAALKARKAKLYTLDELMR